MKIALFGATGTIGQRILRELLRRGHKVTALVRDPSRLASHSGDLSVAEADILDAGTVAAAVAGHDAVVSAYAPPSDNPSVLAHATRALIAGLTEAGVLRLVFVGGAGSLEVAPGLKLIDAPQFPVAFRAIAQAHGEALEILRNEAAQLEWTNLSPAGLIEPGERTGAFRTDTDSLVVDASGQSRISAEDYAIAIADELERPAHVRARFTVGY